MIHNQLFIFIVCILFTTLNYMLLGSQVSVLFLQDPGTPPARRQWPSIDLGTEIYKDPNQVAEWTVSDFDIIVPSSKSND